LRIDEALAESKPLEVKFPGGGVLNIEYRPPAHTIAQMVELEANRSPETLVTLIQELVLGWDLTRVQKVVRPGPNGEEIATEEEVPVDIRNAHDVRTYVPGSLITHITKAVRRDMEVSGE